MFWASFTLSFQSFTLYFDSFETLQKKKLNVIKNHKLQDAKRRLN